MEITQWPVRPTCHDTNSHSTQFGETSWRPKGEKLHPSNDAPRAFRSCSYCGSMHPEDLIEAIKAGATLGGADWKYGWPHKFYVENIPNPNVGNPVNRSSCSLGVGREPTAEQRAQYSEWTVEDTPHGPRWSGKQWEPDGHTTHGKWYNEHLKDLSAEAFAVLAPLLEQNAGIKFEREEDGRIKYSAPAGYQR